METDPPSFKRAGIQAGVDDALRVAAKHFGVSVTDLGSARRTSLIHPARVWAAYLASRTNDENLASIARNLNRDVTIIAMYVRAQARLIAANEENFRLCCKLMRQTCKARRRLE
ncbi:helix-turn-helix domain-containing protein [Bradyrhizobium betae]|uniref:helix-turn-helix domain-containing protein n=1 Tax=Bradyrhizobium betae TaxID=244734 RepID=UPI003D66D368